MKKIVVSNYEQFGEHIDYANNVKHLVILGEEKMDAQDGYHTFEELYDHRFALFIALCKTLAKQIERDGLSAVPNPWKSLKHSDGSMYEGWFVMGINYNKGTQISYHLPNCYWEELAMIETLEKAPEFDGHTPADVVERLKKL
jgi:hypothetical protein